MQNEAGGMLNYSLEPANEQEAELWQIIDTEEDEPIRPLLKRLIRMGKAEFPDVHFSSLQCCSGHVKPDGSLSYWEPSHLEGVKKPGFPKICLAFSLTNDQLKQDILEKLQQYYKKFLMK